MDATDATPPPPAETRAAYVEWFVERMTAPRAFVEEAERVRLA